jgi:hypothetical protein
MGRNGVVSIAFACQLRVMSDKTHVEHNESALTLIADIPGDMDFRCNGRVLTSPVTMF